MTEPIPAQRERHKQSRSAVVFAVVVLGLAALGIISTALLVTLTVTGRIG